MQRWVLAASLLCACVVPVESFAQDTQPSEVRSATRTVLAFVARMEKQLTAIASEMPEERYGFAPTDGAFRGVRTFAQQIKHAAAAQHLAAATVLGERVTADMADERGPDNVKTKAQVLEYLKGSFAALTRAANTIDDANAFAPIESPFGPASNSRLGVIMAAMVHSSNHYGQVVEYLRLNGIIPPRVQ
jgi:uncharacterized damage-inducible protein DinB